MPTRWREILQGDLLEGEHVLVDVVNGELQFTGVEVLEGVAATWGGVDKTLTLRL